MNDSPSFKGVSYPQHNFESAYTTLLEIKELLEILSGIKSPGKRAAFYDELRDAINNINVSLGDKIPYSDTEFLQDTVGAMVTGNTETLISVTYDDTLGKLNFVVASDPLKAPLASPQFTGYPGVYNVGSSAYWYAYAASGQPSGVQLVNNAGLPRWIVMKDGTAESGSNVGSDFDILRYDDAGGYLGTSVFIKRSTGDITLEGLLTLSRGQIAFPATQNPSANANTLDDYEEGTYTPTFTATTPPTGVTYSVQLGLYTKTGRTVTVTQSVTLSSKGSGGVGQISYGGLPFASNSGGGGYHPLAVGFWSTITLVAGYYAIEAMVVSNVIVMYKSNGAGGAALTWAEYNNTSDLYLGGTYQV